MKEVQATEAKACLAADLVPADADEHARRRQAVQALREWRKTLPKTGMSVEDILSARHDGHRF